MSDDLKVIKKLYGEAMMHFIRDNISTLLENDGLLPKLMLDNFAPSHDLFTDLVQNNLLLSFKSFLYNNSLLSKEKKVDEIVSPEELMKEAGYRLYECKTEEDIQAFRKYYAKGEELCTFNGGRLNNCYVFFAIKENVDEIRRSEFFNSERQDLYGTSVISIQFSKDESHTLSIKNRYNHTVINPDATFSNNLDNIILGLTDSFENFYGLKQAHRNNNFEIPGYVRANDGKWYKFNYEINNIYYCPDNIIIDNGEVKKYPKEKYIVMDYFLLDLENKEIRLADSRFEDSFPKTCGKIKKIIVEKKDGKKIIKLENELGEITEIVLDKNNTMLELKSDAIKEISHYFLDSVSFLQSLSLPMVCTVGDDFLFHNATLHTINMPLLKKVGYFFLGGNHMLKELSLPNLITVEAGFLYENTCLSKVFLPKLQVVNNEFLGCNNALTILYLPELEYAGANFCYYNKSIETFLAPKLNIKEARFFYSHPRKNEEMFQSPYKYNPELKR